MFYSYIFARMMIDLTFRRLVVMIGCCPVLFQYADLKEPDDEPHFVVASQLLRPRNSYQSDF